MVLTISVMVLVHFFFHDFSISFLNFVFYKIQKRYTKIMKKKVFFSLVSWSHDDYGIDEQLQ